MKKYNFDFMKMFPVTLAISVVIVVGSLILLFTKGLNYGVDFKGGAEIQIKFEKSVELEAVRSSLGEAGFSGSQVQSIGDASQNEFLIKVASNDDLNKLTDDINIMFQKKFDGMGLDIRKTDIVGPKAGEQLRSSAVQAIVWAILLIVIYIALRFDYEYAPGAVITLIHDAVLIVGIFTLFQKEFSLQIVGALLAVVGYSVNNTVIIFDRVRENVEKATTSDIADVVNVSINETLSRAILTTITTLFVSFVMLFMAGGVIHDFFFAITVGIIGATFSSIFIAAPAISYIQKFRASKAA